jgi:alpha-beta hydrolase superfamily lysophospholipase
MNTETFQFSARDGLQVHTYKWMPDAFPKPKGIVLIVHGSVEHAGRYAHFAAFLTAKGYGVYAPDLRGHGVTGAHNHQLAHLDYITGWGLMLDDIMQLHEIVTRSHPDVPVFLFGHSMGSFAARDLIGNYPVRWAGAIISGSTLGKPILAKSMFPLAKLMLLFYKQNKASKFLHGLVFKPLLKPIKNPRTPFDFISSDPAEVDKYAKDPYCGCPISIGFATEMARGSLRAAMPKTIANTPHELPVLLISGANDPVGGINGKDIKALFELFKANNKQLVTLKLYENARHELINEFVREQVMTDIFQWMDKLFSGKKEFGEAT